MKREGRQHGLVRTYPIIPSPWNPTPHHTNAFNSPPPTAGLFTKVSAKPTNHSKFTGKCSRVRCSDCHAHPAGKAKDKAKGTLKRRTSVDTRLITWRVVDARPAGLLNFSGSSATGILDHLAGADDDYIDDYICKESIGHDEDDDGDRMSFCDAGFVWEQVEEDGWCLVGAEM
ncbi:PREDICTED: uncharacterized protein LOC109180200 [Ipomoea nil]|uniref:uncharacterized protein LOC109180200 n=1 Tax=Ipomoea nil TaxID=35883 RepID=UPI00090189C6|nr:PREDICTED: uncharacterized protein LOC109180200 [Ipomoea nil]